MRLKKEKTVILKLYVIILYLSSSVPPLTIEDMCTC